MLRIAVAIALIVLTVARASATVVSGRITDAQTSAPIAGANFSYFLVPFGPFGDTTTDDNGNYSLDVPQGAANLGFAAPGYVSVNDSREIDAAPLVIDVALYKVSSVSGTVRDAQSMQPVDGEELVLVRANDSSVYAYASTDTDGTYLFEQIPPGSYGVCVMNPSDDYRDMCYDNVLVGADGVLHFSTIDVTPGSSFQGVDFAVVPGAIVSGTLTDSYFGGPIANTRLQVILYSSDRNEVSQHFVFTDSDGGYSLGGLAVGSYYLEIGAPFDTTNTNGAYTPRLYGGGECGSPNEWTACPFDGATPVVVPAEGVGSIDMSLFPGFVVTGRVVDATTGAGLSGVDIFTCDVPFLVGVSATAVTDANGNYAIGHAVNNDTGIFADAAPPHLSVFWPDTIVATGGGCGIPVGNSQLVFTAPNQILSNIDFHLPAGAALSGTVFADSTVAPVSASIAVISTTTPRQVLATAHSDANGRFQIVGDFPAPIAVLAYLDDGADCQVYDSIPCGAGFVPADPTTADVSGAAILNLSAGDFAGSIFFNLHDEIFAGSFE
jgi:hypothetical protein